MELDPGLSLPFERAVSIKGLRCKRIVSILNHIPVKPFVLVTLVTVQQMLTYFYVFTLLN